MNALMASIDKGNTQSLWFMNVSFFVTSELLPHFPVASIYDSMTIEISILGGLLFTKIPG